MQTAEERPGVADDAVGRAQSKEVHTHLYRLRRRINCLFVGRRALFLEVSVLYLSHKYVGADIVCDGLGEELRAVEKILDLKSNPASFNHRPQQFSIR